MTRLSWRNPVAGAYRDVRTQRDSSRTAAAVGAELRMLARQAEGCV